ncbi:hypothetical protein DV736_g1926, partial [Chaetothyriales sp. CBS 134916]
MSEPRSSFGQGGASDGELIAELRERLTEASIKCSERCLYQSAKWAAEMLNSLLVDQGQDGDSQMMNLDIPPSSYRVFSTSYDDPDEAALEARDAPKFILAKSFFDTKEYDRCAAVFLPPPLPAGGLAIFERPKGLTPSSTPSKPKGKTKSEDLPASQFRSISQKSLFLALYARYLAGEKRKEEESEMVLGPADGGQTINRELPALARNLEAFFQERDISDPQLKRSQGWLEYLYGVVLAKSKQESMAQQWLLRSVSLNPYHWGAWEELSSLVSSVEDLNAQLSSPGLPQNIMSLIYQTYVSISLSSTTEPASTLSALQILFSIFPTSTFLSTQLALSHYHAKDYDASTTIFESLLTNHPYRLDALDHYSNILYVMADRPRLAFLAHLCTALDKFRPETCCVVGNYYSLCSQHEKAVMYFRRALTLDRSFVSAWTLMGHEYIELKNNHAALESYRRAVDIERKDYRAWYGLGQAYEVLDMLFYALYYFQRAAGLRPYDAKMWQAVGACYAKMDRLDQAIKALKRALVAGTYFETIESPQASFTTSTTSEHHQQRSKKKTNRTGRKLLDPDTLFQIASYYERLGNEVETVKYMDLCVAQETGSSAPSISATEKRMRKRRRAEARKAELAEVRKQGGGAVSMGPQDSQMSDFGGGGADGDTEILSSPSPPQSSPELAGEDEDEDEEEAEGPEAINDGFGTGTTAVTSKARLWLARYALRTGDLDKSERLAEELCMDGYEAEEAKSLVREVRGLRDADPGVERRGID